MDWEVFSKNILFEVGVGDGARGHEGGERVEEGPLRVDVIETLGLRLGEKELLDADDLEAGLVEFGEDGSGVAFADGVRLDDAEGALRGHYVLPDLL